MDQSFSPRSLRRIWDLETRKGRDLLYLFPAVAAVQARIRTVRGRPGVASGRIPIRVNHLHLPGPTIADLRHQFEVVLDGALTATSIEIAEAIEKGSFRWHLRKTGYKRANRDLFDIHKSPLTFFVEKQLQARLAASTPRPTSRDYAVTGVIRTLDNDLPKAVIRLDVASFYENIEHPELMNAVRRMVSDRTMQSLVEKFLSEMAALTGASKGLPTGVGLSAKLAEMYISQIDPQIRRLPGVQFYARYVDDIVVVIGLLENPSSQAVLTAPIRDVLSRLGLQENVAKTAVLISTANSTLQNFEFLGYSIAKGATVKVTLSHRRIIRMRARIDSAFDAWDGANPANHGRRKLLLDRLRFLTGNTSLANNKRNAMVGVYFSNPHLTDTSCLDGLDQYLKHRLSKSSVPPDLADKIRILSFVSGFRERRYYPMSVVDLRQIRGAWRDAP